MDENIPSCLSPVALTVVCGELTHHMHTFPPIPAIIYSLSICLYTKHCTLMSSVVGDRGTEKIPGLKELMVQHDDRFV